MDHFPFQPDRVVPLSVSSIESGGVLNNSIHISVSYRAPTQHTTDWFVRYQSRDTYRTGRYVYWVVCKTFHVFIFNTGASELVVAYIYEDTLSLIVIRLFGEKRMDTDIRTFVLPFFRPYVEDTLCVELLLQSYANLFEI